MKLSGELFTYNTEPNLTAFETGPSSSKAVVFIGGLGDGLNAVPFLEPLANILTNLGWSLVQVTVSSSFNGYGTTDLQTDAKELDSLVDYLKRDGKTKIVFLGHSTGSQDCYWHNKYGQHKADGYILQAPVSDREYFKANLDNFEENLELAKQLRQKGSGQELLPRDTFWAPITADRFYSLSSKGGDDDVFSTDLTEDEIKELYQGVEQPICWVYSDQDEFYASKEDKEQVMKRFKSICPAIKITANIPQGDHCIVNKDAQLYFFKIVGQFLSHSC